MKTKLIPAMQLLHGVLIILAFAAVAAACIFPDAPYYYFFRTMYLMIPFTVSYLCQKKCRHFASFFIFSLISAAAVFCLSENTFERIYLVFFSIIIMCFRIQPRLSDSEGLLETPHSSAIAIITALFISSYLFKSEALRMIEYYILFVYLINYILYINLSGITDYISEHKNTSNMPSKKIVSTNRLMLCIFIPLMIFLMLLLPSICSDGLGSAILNGIRTFLRWFFGLFDHESSTVEEIAETAAVITEHSQALPKASEGPLWLKYLLNAIFYLMSVLSLIFIAGLIVLAVYKLIRQFYRPDFNSPDSNEFLDKTDNIEDISVPDKKVKKETLRFNFHPDALIRKAYKKYIKESIKESGHELSSIDASYTPHEIEVHSGAVQKSDCKQLHTLYEKARYSKEGCSKEDVNVLKKR